MRFQCPHCQGIITVEDGGTGQAAVCGHCSRTVAVPASRVAPGTVVGDFVIQRILGHGGVGIVYLARQLSLDRPAALKILNPEFSRDAAYVEDFMREARAAAQLNHPNIIQAYAVGEEDGLYYFAMEYVAGSSLKQVIAQSERLVPERALKIVREVNLALDFAWKKQKLIHRDIKPDNIMLTEHGEVKLADLGLARRESDLHAGGAVEIMGTPQYIPPEVLLDRPLDNRSDIYSLGATLYQAVTGRFPFAGDDPADSARRHLTDRLPPPKTIVAGLPDNLNRLIEIMMAKRPEHRHADSAELEKDIALVLNGKMPTHPLHMDAQKPHLLADLLAHHAAKGGKTFTWRKLPAAVATTDGMPAQPHQAPKQRLTSRQLLAVFVTASTLVLGALGGVLVWKGCATPRSEDEKIVAWVAQKFEPAVKTKYLELWRAVADKKTDAICDLRQEFEKRFAGKKDPDTAMLLAKVRALSDPFLEEKLSAWRRTQFEAEKGGWKALPNQPPPLPAPVVPTPAPAPQPTLPPEPVPDAEGAKLAQMREKLREQAVAPALRGDFDGASRVFVPLLVCRRAEFAEWAKAKKRSYELAAKCRFQVSLSGDTLRGQRVTMPAGSGKWTVATVGSSKIVLETRYLVKGEEKIRTAEYDINTVRPELVVELAQKALGPEKAALPESRLMFACYLMARGDLPSFKTTVPVHLAVAAALPDAAVIQDELGKLEPLIRTAQFNTLLSQLKLEADKGNLPQAKIIAAKMKAQHPDLYTAKEKEIAEILKGD